MTKLALVTGGSRGIGAAAAALLWARGWDVLAPTRAELDFNQITSIINYRASLEIFPDAVVFCHGSWYSSHYQNGETYRQLYNERVVHPLDLYRRLDKRPECMVMVASTQAFGGRWHTSPYGAACAAQVRLIQGLTADKDGTRYNAVCPGITDTDMYQQVKASGDCKPDAVPQPPETVAAVIVGLVEDGQSNGRVVRVVDGKATDARWVWE